MITKEQAIAIAQSYVNEEKEGTTYELVLPLENVVEFELGWAFFYQSKTFIETGDVLEMLGGNAPIIVNKDDGTVYITGTAHSVERYIDEYERLKTTR